MKKKARDWSPMVETILMWAGDDHTVDDTIRVAEAMGFSMGSSEEEEEEDEEDEEEDESDKFWTEFRSRLVKAFGDPKKKKTRRFS